MASRQSLKSEKSVGIMMIYIVNAPFSGIFSEFEHWQLAISKPVELGKSYIPQKKALLKEVLKLREFLPWKAPDKC